MGQCGDDWSYIPGYMELPAWSEVGWDGHFHLLIATYDDVPLPAELRDYSFYLSYYEPWVPGKRACVQTACVHVSPALPCNSCVCFRCLH